jgi:hypothetical protein
MQAIERYPTHADHHLYLAELLQKSGRPAAARSALAAAVKLDRAKEAAGHEDKTLPQDRRRALEDLARKLEAHQSAGTH